MKKQVYGFEGRISAKATKVWQGRIFSAWQWEQELYDGSKATWERMRRADTIHTVGVLPDGNLLMVDDQQPNREAAITPPGGMVDEGETAEEAAKREFLEETGYQVGSLRAWHTYRPSAKVDWTVHAFIGRDLEKKGEPTLEPGEKIKLLTYSFDEFLELGHNPKMRDLIIRIVLLEALLDKDKCAELEKLFYG